MEAEKELRTLREMVKRDGICARRFEEAEILAKSIFNEHSRYVPLPYFTPHGESHCQTVERYLDQIIWGTEKERLILGEHDFVPTPEEAMYLLSAAWLHDIGMMYGIFDHEAPAHLRDSKKVTSLRAEHEDRTSKYIHDKWEYNCHWTDDEKTWLTNICLHHRRRHPISGCPQTVNGTHANGPVRLAILAALLRLADACHVDQSRAPAPLMALYDSLGMPQEAVCRWETAKLISKVQFDHRNKMITLVGLCPPVFDFDLGSFDLGKIVEIVCGDIRAELQSVQQFLLPCHNTSFWEVTHKLYYVPSLKIHIEGQCLAMWPYLLHERTSSTEAAAALVQVLLFAVNEAEQARDFGDAWRETISSMIGETVKSRPFDFMIRNLRQDVEQKLSVLPVDAKSAGGLAEYLQSFLKEIRQNCCKMAVYARDLVGPEDVIVVHGYSTNVAKLLKKLRGQYTNALYVVDSYEPAERLSLGPDENKRMMTFTHTLGFDQVKFLPFPAFAQVLSELRRENIPCKLLLGTHGVLRNKGFLCKVGNHMLATTAKELGAEVIAFAEKRKFLLNGEDEADVAGPAKVSPLEVATLQFAYGDTERVPPRVDFVTKDFVDQLVTEHGIETELVLAPTPDEKSVNNSAGGKNRKESNPT